MRFIGMVLLTAAAASPLSASGLSFTLSPNTVFGMPASFPVSVGYAGTLTDTDTANTCDTLGTGCIYLNGISLTFDATDPVGTSTYLSLDTNPFVNITSPSYSPVGNILSDDGPGSGGSGQFYQISAPCADTLGLTDCVFGIQVAPGTPQGVFTGSVSILGGYDDPNAMGVLATQNFALVVAPEPGSAGIFAIGLGLIAWAKRRRGRN